MQEKSLQTQFMLAIIANINLGNNRTMEKYQNLDGNSGITEYEIGSDSIKVLFHDNSLYLYNYSSTGRKNIEEMKKLAIYGKGLNKIH